MLLQAKVKIGRPDDYFAEMMKSDEHMRKIKAKILKQEEKIKQFEEKKLRLDNKKFHKRIKAFKQETKSRDKRESNKKIEQYKEAVRGEDLDNTLDIQKFLTDKKKQKRNVIELMRQQHQQRLDSKKKGKGKGKGNSKDKKHRPGKHSRKMKRRK
jgi:rRNA-processing protein EBP2